MKLHRIAETYNKYNYVMSWCGRMVHFTETVTREQMGTDRECLTCRKAHDAALKRHPEEVRVSATR